MKSINITLLLLSYYIIISCAITHSKKDLIDFQTNKIPEHKLKLDGYFYYEYETDINLENPPSYYKKYITETGITKVKTISSVFIYNDGFTYFLSGIDGLTTYYCAEGRKSENSYQNAHKNIELIINAQKSVDKKVKRRCDFEPDDINRKGITEIDANTIKIQFYQTEMQIPNKDSFNSYYLYEMSGIIENDSTFTITKVKSYRTKKIVDVNYIYKFKKAQKPQLENYFKKNM
jgi:hypothetical protein